MTAIVLGPPRPQPGMIMVEAWCRCLQPGCAQANFCFAPDPINHRSYNDHDRYHWRQHLQLNGYVDMNQLEDTRCEYHPNALVVLGFNPGEVSNYRRGTTLASLWERSA
jgi:hypothetical protein